MFTRRARAVNRDADPRASCRAKRAAATAAALAGQDQIARFFASDGVEVIDPDGPGPLFETPVSPPLPEDVVFFP